MTLAGTLVVALGRSRAGLRLLLASAVATAVLAFLPVGDWLVKPLEDRFPRPELKDAPHGIIVLGGSEDARIALTRRVVALNEAGERIVDAAILARRFPEAKVIISGGSASLVRSLPPEAEASAEVLEGLGVARTRLILETKSRNTGENARFTKDLGVVKPGERWLLVTSAWHMPRAVAAFRGVDLEIVPYPVDFRSEPSVAVAGSARSLPDSLRKVDYVVREWVGLVGYRVTGRSKSLLPAP
jgi:uncharacterized SAM-binding protein YcdF (DUF218 family)